MFCKLYKVHSINIFVVLFLDAFIIYPKNVVPLHQLICRLLTERNDEQGKKGNKAKITHTGELHTSLFCISQNSIGRCCLILTFKDDTDGVLSVPLGEKQYPNSKLITLLRFALYLSSSQSAFNVQPVFKVRVRNFIL